MSRTRASRRDGRGSTLIEILVATALLGIIMVPLGMATMTAWRVVYGIQQKLSSSADAQLLAATFPADVQSAGATGVNPTDPVNADTCAVRAEEGETPLIMFVWDEDLGVSNQSVARYLAKGSGSDSKIIRRFCKGTASSQDVTVAGHFGTTGIQEASLFTLDDDGLTTPKCTSTECFIKITGEYEFQLKVDRRVPGSAPGAYVPDAPTNVHALGSNNRATVYWTDPSDNGAAITGYYLEQMPGGAMLGPFATDGITGAQVNGLTNGQSYTFRVRAANVLGPGPYSVPTGAVTPGPSTPDAPTIGTATPDPAVNGQATVSWTIPSGYNNGGAAIVGYKVYAQHAPDAPVVVDVSNPATMSTTITGLADNTTYGFRVSARNSYGEGSPSALSNVALTLPGRPGTPTAVFTGVPSSVDITFALPTSGDFTSFTNFRAHIIETDTYTTPVAAATACPGTTPTTCTLTVSGLGSSQSYTITAQAQNATGWGPESDALENVDMNAPVVTITTPSGSFVNTGAPTLGGVAGALPGDLPTITVKVYSGATVTGSPVQTITTAAAGSAWSVALSPALASGQYTAVATQKDSTGNTGTSNTKTFTIDTVAPTGSITAPNASAWVHGGAVTVSSNSADALSGVASAEFQYSESGDNVWTTIETDTSSAYSASWDTTYLIDGNYDLRVTTTDNAGNTFTSPIRLVKSDNTVPTTGVPNVSGTLGTNGWYKGTVTVTWPTQPTDAFSGIASTTGCGTTTISTDTAGQVVTCSATDNAGNTSSNSITIKRDATSPSVATLNAMGSFITNGKVLTGTGTDATSGIGSITYLYCSGASCTPANIVIGSSSAAGTYPVTWNSMPANGAYRVIARVFDAAGNSRDSALKRVTIDTTAPSGSITAPLANAWLRQSPSVTSVPTDTGGSGVQSVTFQYSPSGAGTWTTIATDNAIPYTQAWNTTLVTDGPYDLRAIIQDNAGNTLTSALVAVKVDNTAPTVVAPSVAGTPGTNGWYTSNVAVTWPTPATDAYSGIASTSGCGTTNVVADTAGQLVTCSATDFAGNTAPSTVTIKRDATIPSSATLVAMTSIAEGKVLTGSGADATSGVNSITYLYCSGAGCTPNIVIGSSTTAATYPVTWTGMPPDGSYRVMSRVTNNAGLTSDSTVQTITIDNTAPVKTTMVMQDSDNNGKINRVLVTFNETLAGYTAGTAPWTLANVPSNGTISSVTVSGMVATVNITEGPWAKDTAVGNFTLALASRATGIRDALGNRSSFAAAAPTDGAKPVPVTVLLNNKSGGTAGTAEVGDFATITYSEPLSVVSACTTWSNDASNQTASVTATITNNASIDPLTLGSPCAIGTLNLNRDYLTTTRTFSGSTAAWNVASETLTITLGTPSGSVNTGVSSAVPTYAPTTGLRDPAGNTMRTTAFSGTSSRF